MILQNLKSFITKRKSIFIFFILAQIVTLIGVFITYNYMEQEVSTQKSYYDDMRTYTVMLSNSKDIDKKLSDILKQYDGIQHIKTVSYEGEYIVYGEYYGKSGKEFTVNLGDNLSESDITSGNKNILIPDKAFIYEETTLSDLKIGDTYNLNGIAYKIIGLTMDGCFYIPFNSMEEENKNQIMGVCVTTNKELSLSEAEQLTNILSNIFEDSVITPPQGEYGSEFNTFKMFVFFVILLLCLGIFNLSYLYIFILEQRKKQYAVFQICGCTKLRGALIYLAEILILSIIAYLAALLLFRFVVLPFVIVMDSMTFLAMSGQSYILLFIFYILIMLLIFLPCIVRYTSKSAVLQYKS